MNAFSFDDLAFVGGLSSITVSILSAECTFVSIYEPNTNLGNSSTIQSSSGNREALVKWNLGLIPVGATLTRATIKLYGDSFFNPGGTSELLLNQAASSWTESTVTWNTKPSVGTPLGSAPVADSGQINEYLYSSSSLLSLLQSWVSGSIVNNGVYLRNSSSGVVNLLSDDSSNSARHPVLDITYLSA